MLENQIEAQLWTQVDANNARLQCQNKQVCTSKSAILILTNFDQFFHFKVPLATIYALHLSALTQLSANWFWISISSIIAFSRIMTSKMCRSCV